ncbi:phosphatidate cytidylyltransferase [candidate division KSB1 bacterium]|nr:phosphatidate cytidylyltransferase [candidate division KSB1 bacterium]
MNFKSFAIRTAVALALGPLVLFLTWKGGYFLFALVLIVSTVSYWEFVHLAYKKNAFPQLFAGEIMITGAVLALFCSKAALIPVVLGGTILTLFVELYRKKGSPLLNSSATLFGAFYFSLLFGSLLLIRELPLIYDFEYAEAGEWLVMLIVVTWVCDTAAYVLGSYFGRHKLIPRISPNKSLEGTIAGFLCAILAAYAFHMLFIDHLSSLDCMAIGAIIGSFGQYGDLFESMLKRDANVKDTSHLIPGHGGMMDRFDSLMISGPMMYLYLIYVAF